MKLPKGGFNLFFSIFTLIVLISIGVSSVFKFGQFDYNKGFLIFTGIGISVAIAFWVLFVTFSAINVIAQKNPLLKILSIGHVAENPIFKTLYNPFVRIGIIIIWSVIVGGLALNGFQIWAEPSAYDSISAFSNVPSQSLAVENKGFFTSIYDTAIIPGYVEDFASFGLSVAITMFILLVIYSWHIFTKNNFFKINLGWVITAIIVACPIASIGLGFIPGFAQAHQIVGGQNLAFLASTALFQTLNLYVFWITGLIFPLAHIVHNSIFVLGFSVALSITLSIIPIVLIKKKNNIRRG